MRKTKPFVVNGNTWRDAARRRQGAMNLHFFADHCTWQFGALAIIIEIKNEDDSGSFEI